VSASLSTIAMSGFCRGRVIAAVSKFWVDQRGAHNRLLS
jgi:hypothetical protein